MTLVQALVSVTIRRRTTEQMTTEEVAQALVRLGRNDGPAALFDLYFAARVPNAVLRDVLIGVWTAAEFPERNVTRPVWLYWFGVANQVARYPAPTEPIRIYRGATSKFARRMSWTTDREQAIWFANRLGDVSALGPGNLYEVLAPPEAILADVDAVEGDGGRREHEIIVDPRRLPPLRRVCEWAQRSR